MTDYDWQYLRHYPDGHGQRQLRSHRRLLWGVHHHADVRDTYGESVFLPEGGFCSQVRALQPYSYGTRAGNGAHAARLVHHPQRGRPCL